MREQLVSQQIKPLLGQVDARRIVTGEPLLPAGFIWGGAEYAVAEVLEAWKETAPCTHGSGEKYVRKHWFRIRTTGGDEMKIYFERKARSAREAKRRWWLYTFTPRGAG
jgi:phosphoribosylglycinamide formyltransferase-1